MFYTIFRTVQNAITEDMVVKKLYCAIALSLCVGLSGCGDSAEDMLLKIKIAESSGDKSQTEIIDMYKQAADMGSEKAALYLANYMIDKGNFKDAMMYAEMFRKSRPAEYDIIRGIVLISDTSSKENGQKGKELLEKAFKANRPQSFYPLAKYHYLNKDYDKAVMFYEKALKNRDNRARYPLAKMYIDELASYNDKNAAFTYLALEHADHPGRESDILLARCYIDSIGTPKNIKKAKELLAKYSARENDLEARFLDMSADINSDDEKTVGEAITKLKSFVNTSGYGDGAYLLYRIYSQGLFGQPKDDKEAVHYIRMAEKDGNAKAYIALANSYLKGIGVSADPEEAFNFASRALTVAPNDPEVAFLIGVMYADGIGTKRDDEKAFKYISQAAASDNVEAKYRKALMLSEGRATPETENEALLIFEKLAKENDYAPAAYQYGELLYAGMGIERNIPEAIIFLKKAVNGGVKEASFILASACDEIGDVGSALNWYKSVAENDSEPNSAEAAARVADIYYDIQNMEEAEKYFLMAAKKDHQGAIENIGRLYYILGRYEEARDWFTKIAKKSAYAQTFLGIMHERGQGFVKNDIYALEWYDKAILRGNIDAMYLKANLIMNSKTIPDEMQSMVLPLMKNAACHGNTEAIMYLGVTYFPSIGSSVTGLGWLALGSRDYNMLDAGKVLNKTSESQETVKSQYIKVRSECNLK